MALSFFYFESVVAGFHNGFRISAKKLLKMSPPFRVSGLKVHFHSFFGRIYPD